MLVRSHRDRLNRTARRRRGATLFAWLIVLTPVILSFFVLALYTASHRHRQLELQNAEDAAALAAVNALVDEYWFTTDPDQQLMIDRARKAAVRFGQLNRVECQPLEIDPNEDNDPCGELVLGTLANPFIKVFDADLNAPLNLYAPHLNAAHLAMRRGGTAAAATAMLDRDVVGFQVQGTSHVLWPGAEPAIPVLPLAIRTDWATNPPSDAQSWDHQIIHRNGEDRYMLDAAGNPVGPGDAPQDTIPEMTVTISDQNGDNGQIADIGIGALAPLVGNAGDPNHPGQIRAGITRTHLNAHDPVDGQLSLHKGPLNQAILPRLIPDGDDLDDLASALADIRGQQRVWLLYDQVEDSPARLRIVGFVAARIMDVKKVGNAVEVVVQPTQMITCTAITDHTRRTRGPRQVFGTESIHNPYVCRARLVE